MRTEDFRVAVCDGKYTFVSYTDGYQEVLRYGEKWRDGLGDKFMYSIASELSTTRQQLLAAQVDNKRLRDVIADYVETNNASWLEISNAAIAAGTSTVVLTDKQAAALNKYNALSQALATPPDLSALSLHDAELKADKDEAYFERNNLVAALARLYPSGICETSIEGWDPEWNGCCYIDLPTGQISYHYHVSQAHLFAALPPFVGEWDGHDKAAVHVRLAGLRRDVANERKEGAMEALEKVLSIMPAGYYATVNIRCMLAELDQAPQPATTKEGEKP